MKAGGSLRPVAAQDWCSVLKSDGMGLLIINHKYFTLKKATLQYEMHYFLDIHKIFSSEARNYGKYNLHS